MKKNLVLGLGNTIVSDDGVGIYAAREVLKKLNSTPLLESIEVKEASVGGFDLIDLITGFEKAIIIDAIKTENGIPGTIYELTHDDIKRTTFRLAFIHEIDLPMGLELGKMLKIPMPNEIKIIAIEADDITTFSESMTPKVNAALDGVVKLVFEYLE